MIEFFGDRRETCGVLGKADETIVFKRRGKSTTRFTENYIYESLLQNDTLIVNGDVIVRTGGDRLFVVSRRDSYLSKIAQMQKINCTVDIVRLVDKYSGTIKVGQQEQSLFTNQPSVQTVITANMRLYDSGLLASTTRKFLLPNIGIQKLDRIKFNHDNFQVDAIDPMAYEGLLLVQTSQDTRGVVT